MSDWLYFYTKWAIFQLHIMARKSYIQWDDNDVRFVLDQHALLDFYSASSLKQQSANGHVKIVSLWHIILIPSQKVLALSPWCCMFSVETTNTFFFFFGLIQWGVRTHNLEYSCIYIFVHLSDRTTVNIEPRPNALDVRSLTITIAIRLPSCW